MMKKFFLIVLTISFFSCGDNEVKRPANLLTEQQMENILYDMALLQAMNAVTPQEMYNNGIIAGNYIYKKYNIDSLTLVQNEKYYAYNIEELQNIQKRVAERLKAEQAPFDSIPNKKNVKPKTAKKILVPTAK